MYTEMITAAAMHHGDYQSLLRFDEFEHPSALQVGGSDPALMAEAASRAADFGSHGFISERYLDGIRRLPVLQWNLIWRLVFRHHGSDG